jgi:hypothetical protein
MKKKSLESTMKRNNKLPFITVQDRKLGDEWKGWQGNQEAGELDTNTGKRIFLGVLLGGIVLSGIILALLWYMITPRLAQFHRSLPEISGMIFLVVWGAVAFWFLLMVFSIVIEKDIFLRLRGKEYSVTFLVPLVQRIGTTLGISRDRMGNSFVKVSNSLIRITARTVKPESLLILLPRCLRKELLQTITKILKANNIPVFTVAGGTKAREIVAKLHPKAIIGVACERDLLSGIQDIIRQIPVIGVPNVRPEGPCKNTQIDLHELESAIQAFIGRRIVFSA